MSRNLRARIERLELRKAAGPRRRIWDVLSGTATVEALDEADREILRQWEAGSPDRLRHHPAMIFLREQWDRLGFPDPGEYDDLDIIEEAIRLAGIPTPPAPPCGLKERPANEPSSHEPPGDGPSGIGGDPHA
jgi:hypothetical protein